MSHLPNDLGQNQKLLRLLAYPNQEAEVLEHRVIELRRLGGLDLIECGDEIVNGVSIIGKGYCGLVILAQWHPTNQPLREVALKVRRTDAPKMSLDTEANNLGRANSLNIGPTCYAHSQNFLVMDYLNGPTLYQWLLSMPPRKAVLSALKNLLWQCYRLDQTALDHGNLRCVTEHVLMKNDCPILIDFSSSSCDRKPANVTTLIQGLLWGTVLSSSFKRYLPIPDKEILIPRLRDYKYFQSQNNFLQILDTLGLNQKISE